MRPDFRDIRSRIPEAPFWWDENGVPRYCEFHPTHAAKVNCAEVALVEIACRGCRFMFYIAFSHVNIFDNTIAGAILAGTLEYGEPPNIGCCREGPDMESERGPVIQCPPSALMGQKGLG